ncbi:glycosyltransferase family 2 protein [Mangrovibacterium diazotrophicum]|uniref:Glycosyltransferase involved in cell wall biosynthesis n=1 Tax=Mangrovibacterium diazotrophicum TaxID=1261403 RepID=A0A419VX02_9BACT|nr:glycosyltransferase family 2 protein [Mangrovibacterium diazotrophicum]RKD87726.1 glycosyltransferase involved in cell wall biosynthesis [Mangrovibacterium diazotrophicum]
MKTSIAAIILTYNEEKHIVRCIQSLSALVDEVFVVDSFSTDKTMELAAQLGAKVYQNPFVNQAVQFNWALKNCPIESDWIIRIDADEYIDNKQGLDLRAYLAERPAGVNGLIISRKIVFMGRELLHGGWYPKWNLRVFRQGMGECENRWMDEHIVLSEGQAEYLKLDFVDENLNDLSWWTQKHNNYSSREAADYYLQLEQFQSEHAVDAKFFGSDAERKRWLKAKYHAFPLFIRPMLNFVYRYFFKLGFLDGKAGFVWHVLQGFWYRFLVDAKIYELRRRFGNDTEAIIQYIRENYRLD